jgi:hypothetical protein
MAGFSPPGLDALSCSRATFIAELHQISFDGGYHVYKPQRTCAWNPSL